MGHGGERLKWGTEVEREEGGEADMGGRGRWTDREVKPKSEVEEEQEEVEAESKEAEVRATGRRGGGLERGIGGRGRGG